VNWVDFGFGYQFCTHLGVTRRSIINRAGVNSEHKQSYFYTNFLIGDAKDKKQYERMRILHEEIFKAGVLMC
jgi:hypothetical protein